jgi:hypothetical protein
MNGGQSTSPPLTVGALRDALAEFDPDDEVRVVFHGHARPSFNLPAVMVNGPVARGGQVRGHSLNIICQEDTAA